ncbi:MAG TPA: MBL fold metallo-hydrolase [Vicinamibacteria bacterium]|nr:MBL fold metallo-hydrolase [Vicinamibacteria bacterium]
MTVVADRIAASGGVAIFVGHDALLTAIADELQEATVVSANPGSPLFGPPGAVALGRRSKGLWHLERVEALCTLDAVRFRLPLVVAVRRLAPRGRPVLLGVPDTSRGAAGAELLSALRGVLEAKHVFRCEGMTSSDPDRTARWDEYLASARPANVDLGEVNLIGAPPPLEETSAWPGRQVALLSADGTTIAFGEAIELEEPRLVIRAGPFEPTGIASLLARDARRDGAGRLRTERRERTGVRNPVAGDLRALATRATALLTPPVLSLQSSKAHLVNGIFGDPLLHVRLRYRRRSLLFDLGETGRLPARIVHQVSDIFVSHAHFDHIGGFSWLLRSSIGSPMCRRIHGPPGLAEHLEGTIRGILWDRIGERGPVFEVLELERGVLRRFRLQAGRRGVEALEARTVEDGVILEEPELRVRAVELWHGVPVLGFALEERLGFLIRADALVRHGLEPGRWLGELKRALAAGEPGTAIALPDGRRSAAGELAETFVRKRSGQKLVYATDLDDNERNREALVDFARGARFFFCEASFLDRDAHLARATRHLTARACGEIAAAASVERLVPFHFSKRYEREPALVYQEVGAAFPNVVVASKVDS